ncbi:MAG: hypothetical protein KQH83_10115 [Actinobacteria bacterium]|nr:hypothetical protein [Actinomycetota bacterium]
MKSRTLLLTVVLLVAVVAACGDDDAGTTSSTAAPAGTEAATTTAAPATTTTMAATTSAPTTTAAGPMEPTGLIAFTDTDDAGRFMVAVLDPTGGEVQHLTDPETISPLMPQWSDTGDRIAFWNLDASGEEFVFTIDADGSGLTQVTDFSSAVADWHPDGGSLVFNNDSEGEVQDTPDVAVMNLDGTGFTQLVDSDPTLDFGAHWSPAGDAILFLSDRTGAFAIHLLEVVSGEVTEVLSLPGLGISQANWSRDGSRIVFTTFAEGGANSDVWVAAADGSDPVQLTSNPGIDENATFSPNGDWIVFTSDQGGQMDLWIMRSDGSDMRQLTDDMGPDLWADWGP